MRISYLQAVEYLIHLHPLKAHTKKTFETDPVCYKYINFFNVDILSKSGFDSLSSCTAVFARVNINEAST